MTVTSGSNRAVLYARVSSKDQEREGFSIPAQLKLLRQYAREQHLMIVREFVDVETPERAQLEPQDSTRWSRSCGFSWNGTRSGRK